MSNETLKINQVIYLINPKYPVEYSELTSIYTIEEDASIYIRKCTVKDKIRERYTLHCENDSKQYSWNSKSNLLLRKNCNLFAYEYYLMTDNEVGEYLFHQSKFQEILRNTQRIIECCVYDKIVDTKILKLIDEYYILQNSFMNEHKILQSLRTKRIEDYLANSLNFSD